MLMDDLPQHLRKQTARWTRLAADRFGLTRREINRTLHAQFGDVASADLTLLYLRFAWVLDGLGTGEYDLISGPATCEEPLEGDREITHDARLLNEFLVKLVHSHYGVALTTINKALKQQFGPVAEASCPQLILRASALLRSAASNEDKANEAPSTPQRGRARHKDRSPTWRALHREYTDQVWQLVRETGTTAATINATMYKLRGGITSETEASLPSRIELLSQTFPQGTD